MTAPYRDPPEREEPPRAKLPQHMLRAFLITLPFVYGVELAYETFPRVSEHGATAFFSLVCVGLVAFILAVKWEWFE